MYFYILEVNNLKVELKNFILQWYYKGIKYIGINLREKT